MAPDAFVCPITSEVMDWPVVAEDGHSYERAAIAEWLARNARSPLTNAPMGQGLVPNTTLRKAIAEWRERLPLSLDPEALSLSSDRLGVGSFGMVIGGTLQTHGRAQRVAVKTLSAMTQAEQRERLEAEVRAHVVAQQGADGVCRLLGTCEKNGAVYLVMRRYECSLADRLGGLGGLSGLGDAEVRRIGHSLCVTLGQLHGAGVIVSDIKPANVLFDAHDRPVLADFGIAALVGRTTRIVPTSVKGTFNYMAPEAFEPPYGVEADIWSMGALLVEMHTGRAPWAQMNMQQIVTAVLVRRRAPDVPDTMPCAETVRECFRFAPRDRPTAGALAAALNEAPLESGTAHEKLRKTAEKGDADAQCMMGHAYYHGEGVQQDREAAVSWYRKAAEQGDASAQCMMGNAYYRGLGVEQDHEAAVSWYRKAAEKGYEYAQRCMGFAYYNGRGVEQDHEVGASWYRKAAEQGSAIAQSWMGYAYSEGKGVEQDHGVAVSWYRKAAGQGNAGAQYAMGDAYYEGTGVAQDHEAAVSWYRKAAEQGHADAQYMMGHAYSIGEGVAQDHEVAVSDRKSVV